MPPADSPVSHHPTVQVVSSHGAGADAEAGAGDVEVQVVPVHRTATNLFPGNETSEDWTGWTRGHGSAADPHSQDLIARTCRQRFMGSIPTSVSALQASPGIREAWAQEQ